MESDYVLVSHEIERGVLVLCLKSRAAHKDFIDDWQRKDKPQGSLDNFIALLKRLQARGIFSLVRTNKLECIDGNLCWYEIKNYSDADRVMAVIRESETPILLYRYPAHRGGNSNNDPSMMKDVEKRAKEANRLIDEERSGGNGYYPGKQL